MDNIERARRFHEARTSLNQHGKQTMKEVYQETGVSASAICELEKGESDRSPTGEVLRKLSEHYGVNLAWLAGTSDSWSLNEDTQALNRMTGLSTEALENLKRIMEDDNSRECVNILLAAPEFEEMIAALRAARRFSRLNPEGSISMKDPEAMPDSVDYQAVVNSFRNEPTLTFSEGEMEELFVWKAAKALERFFMTRED